MTTQDKKNKGLNTEKDLLEAINKLKEKNKALDDDERAAIEFVGDKRAIELDNIQRIIDARNFLLKAQEIGLTLSGEELQLHEARVKEAEKLTGLNHENMLTLEEIVELNKEDEKTIRRKRKLAKEYDRFWGGIATKIGIGNSNLTKGVNNFMRMTVELKNNDEKMKQFVKSGKRMFSVSNIIGRVLENTIALAVEVDKLSAKFAATTGTGRDFQQQLAIGARQGLDMQLSMERMGQAFTAVNQGLIGSANMSKEVQREFALQIGQFDKIGIKGGEVVDIMNSLQASMQITSSEALNLTKDIALFGTELGIGPAKAAGDFKKAAGVLAVYGNKSIDVFKGLAVAARNSGTEISELLTISNKFDTFESAAETAGKLNSILGGTMSATDMLMMKEDERIETLIRAVNAGDKQFAQMDRFTQKAIAQAAGISDMSKANQIFGMSLSAYKDQQVQAQRSEKLQEKFNEILTATLPIGEKFAFELQRMALDGETVNKIVDAMNFGLKIFKYAIDFASSGVGQFLVGAALFTKVMGLIPGVTTFASAAIKEYAASIFAAGRTTDAETTKMVPKLGVLGTAATMTGTQMAGFGLAVALMGAGLGAAAYGFSFLVESFKKLEFSEFVMAAAAIAGLTYALYGLSTALLGMALPTTQVGVAALVGVGAAAALIGVGIGAAAEGVGKMIGYMTGAAQTAESMTALVEGAKELSEYMSNMPNKVEFQTTLKNLALITTGRAEGLSTAKTGVMSAVNNISNSIDNNLTIKMEIDGEPIDAKILKISTEVADGRQQ